MSSFLTKKVESFQVMGLEVRTTNKAEFSGNGRIASLWQQFFAEDTAAKIPNKIDNAIIVCYYDYESDYTGEYSYLVGVRVEDLEEIPESMAGLTVPTGNYAIFTTNKGPVVPEIVKTWQHIWQLEEDDALKRSYYIDFEVHDERSLNPDDGQVDIYIGIE